MIVLVTGGRNYANTAAVNEALNRRRVNFVIEGGCVGADRLARQWAEARSIPYATVPAHWNRLGKKAGPIRNGWMLRLRPDLVLAFPGGAGTADMIEQAEAAGVPVEREGIRSIA